MKNLFRKFRFQNFAKSVASFVLILSLLFILSCKKNQNASAANSVNSANQSSANQKNQSLKKSEKIFKSIIVKNNGNKKISLSDNSYNYLFAENDTEVGIRKIIANEKFFINEFPIPKNPENISLEYLVNGDVCLYKKNLTWIVDGKEFENYEDAAYALLERIPEGLEFRLYDKDGDGFADEIHLDYLEGFIVDKILLNEDESFSLKRLELSDFVTQVSGEGRAYDSEHFSKNSCEKVLAKNFDSSIKVGDVVLFSYVSDGWKIVKAEKKSGVLTGGEDHKFYKIADEKFADAMRFSRDNIIISNRCGEFFNTLKYFGFVDDDSDDGDSSVGLAKETDANFYSENLAGGSGAENSSENLEKESNTENFSVGVSGTSVAVANPSGKVSGNSLSKTGEKLKVNLYLVPTSEENIYGAPIAFTCDFETSKIFLENALSFAKSKLAEQNQNANSNLLSFEQLNSVIQNAQNLLENSSINNATILNYEMYLLYLALNGTQDDIGAQFANYNFSGFFAD